MKNIFALMVVAGFSAMVACGPSANQQAQEQAKLDSLQADSIAQVEAQKEADSIAAAQAAAQVADSTVAADSTVVAE